MEPGCRDGWRPGAPTFPESCGPRRGSRRSSDAACCCRFLCWEAGSSGPPPRSSAAVPMLTEAEATDTVVTAASLLSSTMGYSSYHLDERADASTSCKCFLGVQQSQQWVIVVATWMREQMPVRPVSASLVFSNLNSMSYPIRFPFLIFLNLPFKSFRFPL